MTVKKRSDVNIEEAKGETKGKKELSNESKKRKAPAAPLNTNDQIGKVAKVTSTGDAPSGQRCSKPHRKTSIWEKLQNLKYKNGDISGSTSSSAWFQSQILKLDKYAVIVDAKSVRHLKCGKTLIMKYPYNARNFETHVRNCQGPPKSSKLPGGGMMPINSFFKTAVRSSLMTKAQPKLPEPKQDLPCPGLCTQRYSKIEGYLERTGAFGGAAPSVTNIAFELYGKPYNQLSETRKTQVKTWQRHKWTWRNEHDMDRVYKLTALKKHCLHAPT